MVNGSEKTVGMDWSKQPGKSDVACTADEIGEHEVGPASPIVVVHGAGKFCGLSQDTFFFFQKDRTSILPPEFGLVYHRYLQIRHYQCTNRLLSIYSNTQGGEIENLKFMVKIDYNIIV